MTTSENHGRGPQARRSDDMEVHSLEELVGHTPLVRLDRLEPSGRLLAKVETMNPGGSIKDRTAMAMLEAAERDGLISAGGTIVEATSGNTGAALAMLAARRGYRCIFVMPDKMSAEKVGLLRAYGAEVVLCPTAVAPEDPESYYSVTARLAGEIPGAWSPSQYHNPANPAAHAASTGPEIVAATRGRVTHFVCGIGTGGTISGVGAHLKAEVPGVRVVGADPLGSVYSGGDGRPYLVEGIGEDFWPGTYDPRVVDEVIAVSDAESFNTARRLARVEGLLVGGSAGTAVAAALKVCEGAGDDAVVVALLADSGRAYLSKFHDDSWMAAQGLLESTRGATVGDLLAAKDHGRLPALVRVPSGASAAGALAEMSVWGVSAVVVCDRDAPAPIGSVRGVVGEAELLGAVLEGRDLETVSAISLARRAETLGSGQALEDASAAVLASEGPFVVVDAGSAVGVLARSDVISGLSSLRHQQRR